MTRFFSKYTRTPFTLYIVLIACLAISSPASAIDIIAFGDSITAGTGSNSGGYPARLEQLIESKGKPCTIHNLGIPGERTYQGVDRIITALNTIPADIILIMEGTNDIRSGYPWQTTKLNLQLMIDTAKAKGVIPVLSTLTPSDQRNSENLIPNRYNPMIRELAEENGVILVDQFAAVAQVWDSLNDDGIHPNDAGYLYLAKTWDHTIGDMISPTGEYQDPWSFNVLLTFVLLAISYFFFRLLKKARKSPSKLLLPNKN